MNVSIIMPTYNENIDTIDLSINSILNQSYTCFEFLIIDDNPSSRDLKNYLKNKQLRDSRIKLIFNRENLGLIKSVNKGIKESKGDFIVRMDADDLSTTDRIYEQLKFARKYKLDLVCSNFADFDTKMTYFGNKNQFNQEIVRKIMSHCNIAIGPTISFSRRIMKKLGGYRDLFTDDYDIAARALMHNYRIGYQSNVFVYKKNRNNNISNNHSLEQFISSKIISSAIFNNNYSKLENLDYINNQLSNITIFDVNIFNKFNFYFNKFKEEKSIINFINALIYTFPSRLVFKRNLWMFFVNRKYKKNI